MALSSVSDCASSNRTSGLSLSGRLSDISSVPRNLMIVPESIEHHALSCNERDAFEAEKSQLRIQMETNRLEYAMKERTLKEEREKAIQKAARMETETTELRQQLNAANESYHLQEQAHLATKASLERTADDQRKMQATIVDLQRQLEEQKQLSSDLKFENEHAKQSGYKLESKLRTSTQTAVELEQKHSSIITSGNLAATQQNMEKRIKVDCITTSRSDISFESLKLDAPTECTVIKEPDNGNVQHSQSNVQVLDSIAVNSESLPVVSSCSQHTRFPSTPTRPPSRYHHSSLTPVRFSVDDSIQVPPIRVPIVNTSTAVRAPVVYNEPRNKGKRVEYAVALEDQMRQEKEKRKSQHAEMFAKQEEYFPFGRAGSGAPVRDANSNVVANVTFTRNKGFLPRDHPETPQTYNRYKIRVRSETA
jgi:hypothetical protein